MVRRTLWGCICRPGGRPNKKWINSPAGWLRCENFLLCPKMFEPPETVGEGIRAQAINVLLLRRAVTETERLWVLAVASVEGVETSKVTEAYNNYRASRISFLKGLKSKSVEEIKKKMDEELETGPLYVRPLKGPDALDPLDPS